MNPNPPLAAITRLALVLGAVVGPVHAAPDDTAGRATSLYQQRCARCHDGAAERAPGRAALKLLSADRVRTAMGSGSMREHATGLADADLDALARWVGSDAAPLPPVASSACAPGGHWPADAFAKPHWNGWGAGALQQRYQPGAMARLGVDDVPRLALKWAFAFPDAIRAYSQPAVVGGRLFVGSAGGKVYSLDARSGCTHWEFSARAPVRTAVTVGARGSGAAVYFGDQRGNVYAVDAMSGEQIWSTRVDAHRLAVVTGAPLLYEGRLLVPVASHEEAAAAQPDYPCCTFRGSVVALDAGTGARHWQSYTIETAAAATRRNRRGVQLSGPSGAAVWAAPTIDARKRLVYVTTGNSYSDPASHSANAVIALRLDDGSRVWTRQTTANDASTMACDTAPPGVDNCPEANGPDLDFGASAMLVTWAGDRRALIAGQKSGVVHALDPDRDGALLWQARVGSGGKLGGVQWGTAADERHAYVAVSDLRTAYAAPGTPGAQPTPFGIQLQVDPDAGGGLVALRLDTGAVAWRTPHPGCGGKPGCSPAQSAAVTAIPGVVFSGGIDGHLRAYAAADGRILWHTDTQQSFATVNGVAGRGGSLDGPGAVVVDGMVYVNSGYALFGGTPGNVLLAFAVGGSPPPAREP